MRDFFRQCFKNLEACNGSRQYFFLTTDPDGEQQMKFMLDGMERVSEKFKAVPQKVQQDHITKRMIEEATKYDKLSIGLIHKWLDELKGLYGIMDKTIKDGPTDALSKYNALSEEGKAQFKREYEDLYGVGKGIFRDPNEAVEFPEGEMSSRIAEFRDSVRSKAPAPPLQKFVLDGMEIEAHTIEEARHKQRKLIEQQHEAI